MDMKMRILTTMLLIMAAMTTFAGDTIRICGQNVQNFFYSLDRERTQSNWVPLSNYNTAEGRQAKAEAIIYALAPCVADIYAFNEVEARTTTAVTEAMQVLATEMSKATGYNYAMVADGLTYDPQTDATGQIKSGFIYRTDRIEPVGNNTSTAVGYTAAYPYMMRMQTFRSKASGEQFTLSMNHFKASTSGDINEDMKKREQNSIALLKGLDGAQDPDILLMGDLNSMLGEQCLNNLQDAGFEEQIVRFSGDDAYSYWYDSGELIDHVFANSTMARQIVAASVMHIATPHAVGRGNAYSDHDPYIVTLALEAQPAVTYRYVKTTTLTPGARYLMVAPINGLQAAKTVAVDKSYEYLTTTGVNEENGTITMDNGCQAFKFEDTGEGHYYMKDYYGRYVYQYYNTSSGKYNSSTNVGIRQQAHPFDVMPQADGTFKIQNNMSDCYFMGLTYNGTPEFALYNYASLRSGQYLPWLYRYDDEDHPTAIMTLGDAPRQTTIRKVWENGQLLILMSDGRRYNLLKMQRE